MNQPIDHHRHRVYLDDLIQRRLLLLLVLMELAIVTAVIAWLYLEFRTVIEHGLYRIHHHDQHEAWPMLLSATWRAIGVLLLVNAFALVVADRIWARYVNGVLGRFGRLMARTTALDLGADTEPAGLHRVVDLASAWRQYEHRIWCDIRTEVEALEGSTSAPFDRERTREGLARLQRLLADPPVEDAAARTVPKATRVQ